MAFSSLWLTRRSLTNVLLCSPDSPDKWLSSERIRLRPRTSRPSISKKSCCWFWIRFFGTLTLTNTRAEAFSSAYFCLLTQKWFSVRETFQNKYLARIGKIFQAWKFALKLGKIALKLTAIEHRHGLHSARPVHLVHHRCIPDSAVS